MRHPLTEAVHQQEPAGHRKLRPPRTYVGWKTRENRSNWGWKTKNRPVEGAMRSSSARRAARVCFVIVVVFAVSVAVWGFFLPLPAAPGRTYTNADFRIAELAEGHDEDGDGIGDQALLAAGYDLQTLVDTDRFGPARCGRCLLRDPPCGPAAALLRGRCARVGYLWAHCGALSDDRLIPAHDRVRPIR